MKPIFASILAAFAGMLSSVSERLLKCSAPLSSLRPGYLMPYDNVTDDPSIYRSLLITLSPVSLLSNSFSALPPSAAPAVPPEEHRLEKRGRVIMQWEREYDAQQRAKALVSKYDEIDGHPRRTNPNDRTAQIEAVLRASFGSYGDRPGFKLRTDKAETDRELEALKRSMRVEQPATPAQYGQRRPPSPLPPPSYSTLSSSSRGSGGFSTGLNGHGGSHNGRSVSPSVASTVISSSSSSSAGRSSVSSRRHRSRPLPQPPVTAIPQLKKHQQSTSAGKSRYHVPDNFVIEGEQSS